MNTQTSSTTLEETLRGYCAEAGGHLQAVCCHALAGGGRTRAGLLLRAAERQDREAVQAACALEMMHAATLLQDDIFDRSAERRGRRAAYLQYGEAQTVLASDWLLLRSLELAAEVHPTFFQQLAGAARTMAAAVAKELKPPALSGLSAASSYVAEICQGKTASLFAVSLHAAALLRPEIDAVAARGWSAVGNRIGCTYQLLDDCLDVYAAESVLEKSTGVDLQQGRLTLPLLTALRSLRPEAQGVSMERFLTASLSSRETERLLHAVASDPVRAYLKSRVAEEMRSTEESARRTTIPRDAVASALSDMNAKWMMCFGDGGAEQKPTAGHPQEVHAA